MGFAAVVNIDPHYRDILVVPGGGLRLAAACSCLVVDHETAPGLHYIAVGYLGSS